MWRALSPFFWIVVIVVLLVVSIKFGFGAVMNFVDPGGTGPIMAWPLTEARLPHIVRNLGGLFVLLGVVAAWAHDWSRGHGLRWIGGGVVMLAVGILGPTTADWANVQVPVWWSTLLNHPGDIWSQLGGQ